MKRLFALFLLLIAAGCRTIEPQPDVPLLIHWQQQALERHLDGECAIALQTLADTTRRRSHRQDLADIARFIRENGNDASTELLCHLLWESVEYCNVQFVRDPALFIRNLRRSEITCRTALLIAEKQFLDQIIWKTPEQKVREREVNSELSSLCGGLPSGDVPRIQLALPGDPLPELPGDLTQPVSEDPAEPLQFASAVYQLPDEIRRQKMADSSFYPDCLLNEVLFQAVSYTLHASFARLRTAQQTAKNDPSPANLWRFHQWYYRVQMELSRLPAIRGEEKDRQFLNSILLLQEGF